MYQLISNNILLGYVVEPMYCCKLSSGSTQVIGPKERAGGLVATGILYLGTVYNLPGSSEFEDADTVYLSKVDEGVLLTSLNQYVTSLNLASSDMDSLAVDQELRITILELGLNEEE